MQRPLSMLTELEPARALSEDTLQRCHRMFGPDHPITLGAAAGLALALDQLGKGQLARTLGQDTLRRCRRVLGPDHPITRYLAQVAMNDHPPLGDEATEDHPSSPR